MGNRDKLSTEGFAGEGVEEEFGDDDTPIEPDVNFDAAKDNDSLEGFVGGVLADEVCYRNI